METTAHAHTPVPADTIHPGDVIAIPAQGVAEATILGLPRTVRNCHHHGLMFDYRGDPGRNDGHNVSGTYTVDPAGYVFLVRHATSRRDAQARSAQRSAAVVLRWLLEEPLPPLWWEIGASPDRELKAQVYTGDDYGHARQILLAWARHIGSPLHEEAGPDGTVRGYVRGEVAEVPVNIWGVTAPAAPARAAAVGA